MSDQHLRPGPGESVLPGAGDPVDPAAPTNPWERRRDVGWTKALIQTTKLFLLDPAKGFSVTRIRGGFRGPVLFALFFSFVVVLFAGIVDGFYQLAVDPGSSGDLSDLFNMEIQGERLTGVEWLPASMVGAASIAGCFLGLLVGIPVFALMFPLVMLAWTGILHLCLKLVGGLRRSEAGYQGTWAVVCYATVAFLAGVVPVIGDWIAFFWLGLLQGIGFWRLHRTTPIRATVALLLPFSIPGALWLMKWMGPFPIVASAVP